MTNGPSTPQSNILPPPEHKAAYVRQMFGHIARRYDLMNRLMTLGQDRAWRRYTVTHVSLAGDDSRPSPGRLLDVATGTGDLALEASRQQPGSQVVGLDFTSEMLALAQHKAIEVRADLDLIGGDAMRLPFADGAFEAVVTGFALRNVSDIPAAFAEMARVTCPGGRVACLEISKPRLTLFRRLFALYFYRLVPLVGGWISGQRAAYTYLPHSLTGFLTPDEIVAVMCRTGWVDVSYRRMMLGTVAVHVGTRGTD
jgi:demethylmenaquinone methyltransferase/2-methoxy-6-polyprenyl-1,4-benzoquinol methylase